jgi:hypothetical protein
MFTAAVGALYGASYSLHFLLRNRGIEAPVGHLEGLWESDAPDWLLGPPTANPGTWRWTLLIALPDDATDEDVASAMAVARRRRPSPLDSRLTVMTIHEGACAEAMHVGPYATEPETIELIAPRLKRPACGRTARITRSTSAIRGARRPSGFGRCCATRWPDTGPAAGTIPQTCGSTSFTKRSTARARPSGSRSGKASARWSTPTAAKSRICPATSAGDPCMV